MHIFIQKSEKRIVDLVVFIKIQGNDIKLLHHEKLFFINKSFLFELFFILLIVKQIVFGYFFGTFPKIWDGNRGA